MENDHGVEGHACPLSFSVARLADSAPTVEMTPINADTRNKVVSIVTPKAFRVSLVRVCATTDQRSILLIGDAIFTLLSSQSCIPTEPRAGLAVAGQKGMMRKPPW
jgi:hypothetical protein